MAEKDESKKDEKKEEKPAPKDQLIVTKHTVKIGGKEIKYSVTAGTMVLKEETTDWEKESDGETLRKAMTFNPYLKVFVANGDYDLGTPYFATEYTFDHLRLDEDLRRNISMEYYDAGHMMYIHMPSLRQMKKDLADFIKGAM